MRSPSLTAVRIYLPAVLAWLLVKPDHISRRVAEPRSDLGRVSADGLDDLALVGDDHVKSGRDTVDHDVKQKTGRCCGWTANNPGATSLSGGIVECNAAITPFPNVPTKDLLVEVGRARSVRGGHLDVTDLAVRKRGRHWLLSEWCDSYGAGVNKAILHLAGFSSPNL